MHLPRTLTRTDRPKVLLADNHPQVLKIVARVLAPDFDVVGAAPDGRQALDLSLRLDPDVVILDIGMPELDGFQTLRELRRSGSRAKVVMLTAYDSEAYVASAINDGAQGYVVKSGVYSDLVGAIDHALADRFFVPSLTSLPVGSSHAVHYHTNDRDFLDGVARFARGVLRSGEPFVLVANAETRNGITQRLRNEGTDVSSFVAQGQYVELDTAKALSRFMRNGRPDAASLAEMVAEMEHLRITRGSGSRLTIFGDMARILCLDGNVEGAIELEQTWSRLTRDLPFLTVCSYSVDAFQAPKARELFPHVCAEHSAVTHALHA